MTPSFRRMICVAGVLIALCPWSVPCPAQAQDETQQARDAPQAEEQREVVLSIRGGREVTGVFVRETDTEVVLRIEGIETTFEKSGLASMRWLPPVVERYRSMRALIEDSDLDGRVLLAEWLRSHEQYELALEEINGVLQLDEHHARARELKQWLELQAQLRAGQIDHRTTGADNVEAKEAFAARQKALRAFPLLTPEQINLIKVYEVDLRNPPPLLIKRETIDQLIRAHPDSPLIPATPEGREAIYRKSPEEVLELMFRLRARDLYGQVIVRGHPEAIRRFRSDVHGRWLINSCATTQCHGGGEAGRLWLYDRRPFSDETVYTNLLILERYRLNDGTPLIDYSEPARSPLLQMALPRELSLYPHPEVPRSRGSRGWKPIFRSSSERRFQDAIRWIGAMYRPRPEYPIEYEPPLPFEPPAQDEPEPKPDR